jgi:uncharacterized membrane protein
MNTLKYALKNEWYNIILLALSFLIIPFVWDQLPSEIPTRWNFQGEVTGYSSKNVGLFLMPATNLIVYLILLYLPVIDPKKRIKIDQKPIPVLRTLTVVLLLGIEVWIIVSALGTEIQSQSWLFLGLAVFFLVMGNYLRTIEPNYFIGIRVPWALEDPDNWRETHRVGSYLWVTGGLLLIILFPLFSLQTYGTIFGVVVTMLALIPMGYSFYLYKKMD